MINRDSLKPFLFCIVISCIFFTGCKSKQVALKRPTSTAKTIVERIEEAQPKFTTAQASKINATLTFNNRQMSVNGSIIVITDSALILSIQPLLGIELFRVEVDKTSVKVIDKMNRRYAEMLYTEAEEFINMPITYREIEALFTNRLFILGENGQQKSTPTITTANTHYHLSYRYKNIEQGFEVNKSSYLIEKLTMLQKDTAEMSVIYTNHKTTSDVVFPEKIELNTQLGHQSVNCTFLMPRIIFNQATTARFTDTTKYKRVEIMDLLTK